MSDELDELEMRPVDDPGGEHRGPQPQRPPSSRFVSIALALLALALLLAVGVTVFRYQPWKNRRPATASSPATAGTPTASPEPRAPLPPLDASDEHVRTIAARLSAHPELARWLAGTGLVRTATAVVSNIADGETPRPHLAFLAPRQGFRATGAGRRRIVTDPIGFAGYDLFGDAIAALDSRLTVSAYRSLEPLFDEAYRDLGHPEGFRSALDRALAALLAVPLPPSDAELVPHAVGFRWSDPRLEGLTAAQKQFLRTGPRNQQLVQAKLREIQAALAAASPGASDRS